MLRGAPYTNQRRHVPPGGKRIEADVDASQTATREMVEETGGAHKL